ncbi:sensor histidine kinase [Cohnella sp. GCM10012308]|uniref:cache domain-containing sensor histidine kinase n=1 Tax=Cohnella sp. GCM10012308 TaxID=3317329 RepID=UPI00361ED3CE
MTRTSFANNMSLFYKLFYGILTILVIVFTLSSVSSYFYARTIFREQAIDSTARLVSNINTGFEDNLDQIDRIIMSIYSEADHNPPLSLKQILTKPGYASLKEQLNALQVMESFFQRLMNLRKDFNSIYIYVSPEKQFSYAAYGRNIPEYSPVSEDWYKETVSAGGRTVIFAPHNPFQLQYNQKVVSFSRVLRGLSQDMDKTDGIILIDLSMEAIESIVDKGGLDSATGILLLDRDGKVVYEGGASIGLDEQAVRKLTSLKSGDRTLTTEGKSYFVSFSTIESVGWKTVTLTPYAEMNRFGNRLLLFDIPLGITALAMTALLAYLLSRKLYQPLQELKAGMAQIKQGNFDYRLEVSSNDEFGNLVFSFNKMTSTIKELISEKYEATLAKREAEFKYLQSQINPHFIYNTLQILSGMALLYKTPNIHTVSKNLAKMLRYSISLDRAIVPVREEIENVVCYMDIQKTRFRGFFSYELMIDEDTFACETLKLVLQPIVENAIVHGLEPKEEGGRVVVSCKAVDNRLRFEVLDSGVGMDRERLAQVIARLDGADSPEPSTADTKSNSIGLSNIHKRIQMLYGPEYGLAIDSVKNEWTRVRIDMPLTANEGEIV